MTFDERLTLCITEEQTRIVRYIQRQLKCSLEAAQDVLYDAIESAIRYKNSYKEGLDFTAYIVGIVKKFIWKANNPVDVSVKKRIETSRQQYRSLDKNTEEWLYGINNITPDIIVEYKEQQDILIKFINTLKGRQRDTVLHYAYDIPTKLNASQLKSNWWALLKSMESIKWNAINLTWSW